MSPLTDHRHCLPFLGSNRPAVITTPPDLSCTTSPSAKTGPVFFGWDGLAGIPRRTADQFLEQLDRRVAAPLVLRRVDLLDRPEPRRGLPWHGDDARAW